MTSSRPILAGLIDSNHSRLIVVVVGLCVLLPAAPAIAQLGWSAQVSVRPFPSAYPSAWEFDPGIATVMVMGPPGTDPNFRIQLTMSMGGTTVMTGTSLDRSISPALNNIVYTPDIIDWSTARYSGSVQDFINRTERFPEGSYTISIQILASSTGQVLASSSTEFDLAYPDPPMVLFPYCDATIDNAFPVFQWTPVQTPIQNPVHYVLRIARIYDTQAPATALRENVPWYENLDITTTSIQYPIDAQPLEPGNYVWQVLVLDDAGNPPSKNNGLSELCTFWVDDQSYVEPPVLTDAKVKLIRTLPNDPFAGSSFEGLADKSFQEVLRHLRELVSDKSVPVISLPIPSPKSFEEITLPNAFVSIDSILGSFAFASQIEILGQTVEVVFAGLQAGGTAPKSGEENTGDTTTDNGSSMGGGNFVFGMRPLHFSFGSLIEPLKGTVLDELDLDGNLFAMSGSSFTFDPSMLPPDAAVFFDSAPIDFTPGINFHHKITIPGTVDLLKGPCDVLGIDESEVELSGRIDISLQDLRDGNLITEAVDLSLSATLEGNDPVWLPGWLDFGPRTITFETSSPLKIGASATLHMNIDGTPRTLTASTDVSAIDGSEAVVLRATMDDVWNAPFGVSWLELTDVGVEVSTGGDGNAAAVLTGAFDVGSKSISTSIEVTSTDSSTAARFTGSVDELGLSDVFDLVKTMGLGAPDMSGNDPFTLQDVTMSFESSDANTFAVSAKATVFDVEGDFLVAVAKRPGADPELLLSTSIPKFALSDLAPPLGGTVVGDLTIPKVAFTIVQELSTGTGGGSGSGGDTGSGGGNGGGEGGAGTGGTGGIGTISFPSFSLPPVALDFFSQVYGSGGSGGGNSGGGGGTEGSGGSSGGGGGGIGIPEDFTMVMSPGLNLGGKLPLAPLGPQFLDVLGFTEPNPEVVLQGSLGLEIGFLSGSGLAEIKGWRIHAELPPRDKKGIPDWLEIDPSTQRTLDIAMDPDPEISITDIMKATLDGRRRTFEFSKSLAVEDTSATVGLSGKLVGGWKQPYGIKWMDLDEVAIELSAGTEGAGARLAATTELAGKTIDVSIELEGSKTQQTATFTGSVDKLSADEFVELLTDQIELEGPLFDWSPPGDLLAVTKPTITIVVGTEMAFSVSGMTTVFGQDADLQFFSRKERGQKAQFMLAFRPQELSLSALLPELNSPVLEGLKIPKGALVVSKSERRIRSEDMTDDTREFYGDVYGTSDFDLDIAAGLSLIGPLPLGDLGENSPLKKVLELLSPDASMDQLVLEGTLPGAIFGLGGSSGLAGLSLKANLPPIAPKGSPDWFVEAQLALAITGRPSVGLAGHLTVNVDGDHLTFLTEMNIAVIPAGGIELGVLGALEAEEPWVAPLGVDWLTFNEVRLKTAINPVNVKFGFLARIAIGEKDIEVIAMLPINIYTGVPTGIGLKGASEEGVALADIADLQNAMAKAAGRNQPRLPIDELPNIAISDLDFRFSTINDPDLDLRLGMTIGGQLWVETQRDHMENFAGIYFDVGLDGIIGEAHLGNFALGPMEWKDALLDVAVTLPDRHVIIEGGLDLGFAAGTGSLNMAKRKMALDADVKILNKFGCAVSADGELALGASNLVLHGEMKNDFNGVIAGEIVKAIQGITEIGDDVLGPAQAKLDRAQAIWDEKDRALKLARKEVNEMKVEIARVRDAAQRELAPRKAAKDRADAAKSAAWWKWQKTPLRERKLRKARKADYYRKRDIYKAARKRNTEAIAAYVAADNAYKAIKPVDDYKVVQLAIGALDAASGALDVAQREFEEAKKAATSFIGSIEPGSISVEKASFTGKLARAKQGGGVKMAMTVNVKGDRKYINAEWKFVSVGEIAKSVATGIVTEIASIGD